MHASPYYAKFEQIWPDLGDWNDKSVIPFSNCFMDLNKFDPIKGIETPWGIAIAVAPSSFEQIWPDLGDWNNI